MQALINTLVVMVVLPDFFREMGPQRNSTKATPQGLDQRSKMAEVVTKMCAERLGCVTTQREVT